MRGMLALGLVWPSKCVGRAVRANRMHRQGLDRCPQKTFGIFDVGIRNTHQMVCYSTRKSSKWGVFSFQGSFDLPNGSDKPWWQTVCIERSWWTSTKKFGIFDVGIRITQKMVCYSTRKSSKWGVCSLRGLFDLPNGSKKPLWPTVCIDKVLKDVHEKIWHFWRQKSGSPKK